MSGYDIELVVAEAAPVMCSYSDQELLSAIDHYHGKLPSLLEAMRNRYEQLICQQKSSTTESVPCPSCGTKLHVKVTPVS